MAVDAGARLWLTLGAVNGFFSVALGAFAAHGLKGRLSEQMLDVFAKGVDYQGFHALALLAAGLLLLFQPGSRPLRWRSPCAAEKVGTRAGGSRACLTGSRPERPGTAAASRSRSPSRPATHRRLATTS